MDGEKIHGPTTLLDKYAFQFLIQASTNNNAPPLKFSQNASTKHQKKLGAFIRVINISDAK